MKLKRMKIEEEEEEEEEEGRMRCVKWKDEGRNLGN